MKPITPEELADKSDKLVEAIRPLLYEQDHPAIVGAALAELLGMWLAGHRSLSASGKIDMAINVLRAATQFCAMFDAKLDQDDAERKMPN